MTLNTIQSRPASPRYSLICTDASQAQLLSQSVLSLSDAGMRMIERLSLFGPLEVPGETPWIHLHHCRTQATGIAANSAIGIAPAAVDCLVSVYEDGLLAGFDDLFLSLPDDKVGEFRREVLEQIGSIGWRHGWAIRQWWASYARLVDAWFGKGSA